MPFAKVAAAARLAPGKMLEVTAGGVPYAICNVAGQVYALRGVCPHLGGPLAHGALHGQMVVCPWHAWEFDCRTGENGFDPTLHVETYPARIENGEILADLPDA